MDQDLREDPRLKAIKKASMYRDKKNAVKDNNLVVLNVGNGWVAVGCWDDYS